MCDFNAVELLRRRRMTACDLSIPSKRAAQLIADIDEARWHYQESTGCACWQEAIEVEANQEMARVNRERVAEAVSE